MKKLNKKIFSFISILAISISLLPARSLAEFNWAAPPDAASQALDGIFKKIGANANSVTDLVSKANNLALKNKNPQVTITFLPTNPDPGEKVTATALPMYFGNPGEKLYYTWYLKHKGEEDTVDNLENVFKVRAARIIASDGYEKKESDSYINNSGYNAIFGGDDQQGKGKETGNHCFFYDVDKGAEYEFQECKHLFPKYPSSNREGCPDFSGDEVVGDDTFSDVEECFWETNPANPDTAGKGHTDEANVVGLGATSITWTYQEGDQIGVAIEGASYEPTDYSDSSYKIMWALSKNKCDPACPEGDEECDSKTGLKKIDENDKSIEVIKVDPPKWPDCPDGCQFPRTLITKETSYSQAPSSSYQITTSKIKTVIQIIQLSARKYISGAVEGGAGGKGGKGGSEGSGGDGGDGGDGGKATLGPGICAYSSSFLPTEAACYLEDEIPEAYQSGELKIADASCCPLDGAPETNEKCPLFEQTMCAILSNNESFDNNSASDMAIEPAKEGDGNRFEMNMDDFNKCLLQNFTDPTDSGEGGAGGGGANKKLDVSLSYSPKNPINVPIVIDPVTNKPKSNTYTINADEITVESMMDNAKDSEFLNYTWEVSTTGATEIKDDTEWAAVSKDNLNESSQTIGLGLKNLTFKSRFPEDINFLKVKLTVSETAYNGERSGHSEVFIPIINNKKTLNAYLAKVADNDNLDLSIDTKPICEETDDNTQCATKADGTSDCPNEAVCEVVKNQIIAVKSAVELGDTNLNNFSWTIDGEPIKNYDGSEKALETTYFPITKEVGETFDVSLSATDADGKKTNLTRIFKVINPKITITSESSDTIPVLKGYYTDVDNVSWPDYSETEFETLTGATIKLKATFTGSTPPEDQIKWSVDDVLQSATGSTFSYGAAKAVGESYSINVSGLYSQDNPTAKALFKYWGINYDGLYEKDSSTTIKVEIVGTLSDETAKGNVKKFLASLASGFPSYLSFLFRIILTTALLLFTYRVIFILLPNARREEI